MKKKIYEEKCAFYCEDGKCHALRGDRVTCLNCAFYKTKMQHAADIAKAAIRLNALGKI